MREARPVTTDRLMRRFTSTRLVMLVAGLAIGWTAFFRRAGKYSVSKNGINKIKQLLDLISRRSVAGKYAPAPRFGKG